jgi:hypothetical protein
MNSARPLQSRFRRWPALVAIMAVCSASVAIACNVPVFRYALEHWNPDAYRGVVFHKGPLSDADKERLATMKSDRAGSPFNFAIRTVDLSSEPDAADADLVAAVKDAPLPQLVVQYPVRHQINAVLWKGSFDEPSVKSLVESPARQELIKRLIAGQTAVWVMIDSGDAAQDDTAEATLQAELENLTKTLKLPVQTDAPEDAIGDGPELRVEFSILRIGRQDPAEQALVSMLINSEPDLPTLNDPLVFPVFGRLRALLPLVGPGITPENIRGSARFLAGACSCQVKEQNPGFDLLMNAHWDELIPWAKSKTASGALAGTTTEPELVPIAAGPVATSTPAPAVETPPVAATVPETVPTPTTDPAPTAAPAATTAPAATPPVGPLTRLPLTTVLLIAVAVFFVALLLRR